MAVPLMARLDADMLAKAHNLKVILQYGVGVEGIDIPAVRSLTTSCWVHSLRSAYEAVASHPMFSKSD